MSDEYVAFEINDTKYNIPFAIIVGEGGGDYSIQIRTHFDTMQEKILGITPDMSSKDLALLGVKLIEISTYRNDSDEQHDAIRNGLVQAGFGRLFRDQ